MSSIDKLLRDMSTKAGAHTGQNQMLGEGYGQAAAQGGAWCPPGQSGPRTTMLPMGSTILNFPAAGAGGLPAGDTTFEVRPACGAFVLERLVSPSIFADPFFLVDFKIGPTSMIQVSTTTLANPAFIGISFRQFSELAVNIFQQSITLTSVCPAIITVRNVSGAAQNFSLSGVGYYTSCAS